MSDEQWGRSRTERKWMRVVFSLGIIVFGVLFIALKDWVVAGFIPLPWFGYAFIAVGAIGVCGVNIFIGSPLDPANDPADDEDETPPNQR